MWGWTSGGQSGRTRVGLSDEMVQGGMVVEEYVLCCLPAVVELAALICMVGMSTMPDHD